MSDESEGPASEELLADISRAHSLIEKLDQAVAKRIIGQERLRRRFITGLATEGHLLLEGVPGLAKTLAIKSLAECVNASFQRIQFTPDLLPADLLGTEIFRPKDGTFEVRKGPIFAHFILADEINRSPAKVQSALLEIMAERQVTIAGTTFEVPKPFMVLATQNPVEQEGTYSLPEAQVDRFMMKVKIDYPTPEEEIEMLTKVTSEDFKSHTATQVASVDALLFIKKTATKLYVDDRIKNYIVNVVAATRNPSNFGMDIDNLIELGASPRASISLFEAARAEALMEGEKFVRPQFVKDVAHDVLRHRIIPSYEAEAEGLSTDDLISKILDSVEVP